MYQLEASVAARVCPRRRRAWDDGTGGVAVDQNLDARTYTMKRAPACSRYEGPSVLERAEEFKQYPYPLTRTVQQPMTFPIDYKGACHGNRTCSERPALVGWRVDLSAGGFFALCFVLLVPPPDFQDSPGLFPGWFTRTAAPRPPGLGGAAFCRIRSHLDHKPNSKLCVAFDFELNQTKRGQHFSSFSASQSASTST